MNVSETFLNVSEVIQPFVNEAQKKNKKKRERQRVNVCVCCVFELRLRCQYTFEGNYYTKIILCTFSLERWVGVFDLYTLVSSLLDQ